MSHVSRASDAVFLSNQKWYCGNRWPVHPTGSTPGKCPWFNFFWRWQLIIFYRLFPARAVRRGERARGAAGLPARAQLGALRRLLRRARRARSEARRGRGTYRTHAHMRTLTTHTRARHSSASCSSPFSPDIGYVRNHITHTHTHTHTHTNTHT